MSACECNLNTTGIVYCLGVAVILVLIALISVLILYSHKHRQRSYESFCNNDINLNYQITKEGEEKEEEEEEEEEEKVNATWHRPYECKYAVSSTIAKVLEEKGIKETTNNKFNIYLPCNYNDIKGEINSISTKNTCNNEYYFIVSNADEISGKDKLWQNIKQLYGNDATKIMPKTYILYNPKDISEFKKEYHPNKIYILKKNIQRQEGLKITKNKKEILNAYNKDKYVLVQELLQDPFIIDGRKTNMRFYLLLVCNKGRITAYVHDEGFMYYTAKPFVAGSIDHEVNITTGYIDRSVYERNPLTLGDLRKYIDTNLNSITTSAIVFNRIFEVLNKLTKAISFSVCQDGNLFNCNTFQIFGVDVALNNQLVPQIMEVNKGPDLGGKDERDLNLKKQVITDMFNIIGVIPESSNITDNKFRVIYPEIEYY